MTAELQIETLEEKGLIRLATLQPEIEYLFRHALVQDAAYGSLLKQERRGLHGQVGEALEDLYPERREELAGVLAMHFEQAGETDKAIDYHVAAGNYGLQRNAYREAFEAFDRAGTLLADLAPAEDPEMRRRTVLIRLGRAQAGYSFRSAPELLGELEQLVADVEELGDDRISAKVHMLIALGRLQLGEPPSEPAIQRSLTRMREIGERVGDRSLQALPMALIGMSNVFSGTIREGVRQLAEAVPLLDESHDSIGAAFARGALAIGYAVLGEFDDASAAANRATELAAKGDLIAQLDALIAQSMVASMKGELDAAVPLARECVDRAEETGAAACVMASAWVLGDAFHRQGRFTEAQEILKRGADVSAIVDRRVWRPTLQAWLGTVRANLGETDTDFDEALATARSIKNRGGEAGVLAKRAEAAVARGDIDTALADFEASAQLYEAEGARPNLARVLREWGGTLRGAGRTDEAARVLRRAESLFDELGLEAEAAAVRTELSLGTTKIAFD